MIWGLTHRRFASYNLPRRRQEGKISGQSIINPCPEFGPFGGDSTIPPFRVSSAEVVINQLPRRYIIGSKLVGI